MWICLNDSFLSIVSKECAPDELLVRARVRGHIEAVFPDAKVMRAPGNDYLWRARVKRADIASALVRRVMDYSAPNFKNSVPDDDLHHAYSRVWGAMADLQEIAPYATELRHPPGVFARPTGFKPPVALKKAPAKKRKAQVQRKLPGVVI